MLNKLSTLVDIFTKISAQYIMRKLENQYSIELLFHNANELNKNDEKKLRATYVEEYVIIYHVFNIYYV